MGNTKDEIMHTTDWHLRDSQYCSPSRGEDFTNAALAVIEIAKDRKVKAICNTGDTLHFKRPSSKNIKDLVEIDKRLRELGIPMYVISGNHDMANPSWISILEEGYAAGDKTTGIVDIDNKLISIPGTSLTVYGAPSMGSKAFRATKDSWPSADILMSHELISEFAAFKTDDETLSVVDYPTDKYKALLIGDIHTCKYMLNKEAGSVLGYAGSIELCSKSEPVDKSVSIFHFENGNLTKTNDGFPEIVKVPSRKAVFYRVVNDAQADEALADVIKYKDLDPIVLVSYDRRMCTTPQKFMTVLAGTKSILRCGAFADVTAGHILGLGTDDGTTDHLKQLKDFVGDHVAPGTDIYNLAVTLADPEMDHRRLISDYVNKRMTEHETDTF